MARLIDKGTKDYYRALCMMFFGSLAAFGAEYCLQPVIPILAQDFNLSLTKASLAMSFGTIGMAISMILIASVSKYLERKKVMVLALGISALIILLMSVTEEFTLILLLRFAHFYVLFKFLIRRKFNVIIISRSIYNAGGKHSISPHFSVRSINIKIRMFLTELFIFIQMKP